jgi:protein-tyrosine phosphatase
MTATFDEAELMTRRLQLPGTFNVRDVGGYTAADGRTVRWRTLWRGDALGSVDEAGLELLVTLGVRTCLDLRDIHEREAAPDHLPDDVEVVSVALLGAGSPTALVAGTAGADHDGEPTVPVPEFNGLRDVYLMLVDERGDGLARAVGALARPGALPGIVHCAAGKDRTGVVVALVLGALGVPDELIAADFAATALFLDGDFRARLTQPVTAGGLDPDRVEEMLRSDPELILEVLERVRDRHGSAAAYLLDHGMKPEELEALRAALLEEAPGHLPPPYPTPTAPVPPVSPDSESSHV